MKVYLGFPSSIDDDFKWMPVWILQILLPQGAKGGSGFSFRLDERAERRKEVIDRP